MWLRVREALSGTAMARFVRRVRLALHPPVSKLALRYCTGEGLEVGASVHNPFGLKTRNVDFTDSMETVFKRDERRIFGVAAPVDVVAPADHIPVPDSSEDFVVSSHVLEHVVDPVRCLLEWDRIVRPGGVVFMIVPHKERTDDRDRERTTLAHLIEDYEQRRTVPSVHQGGHEHVWITEDLVELVMWMKADTGVRWRLLEVADVDHKVGNGFTIVIRKTAERATVPVADAG
jgi:SAM-dependent methyltransferase